MQDLAQREFAEELLSYTDSFRKGVAASFKGDLTCEAGKQCAHGFD